MSVPKGGYMELDQTSISQQELCTQTQKYNLKVPQVNHAQEAFTTVPDDGLGYDDGVRVLRSIGSWASDYSSGSSTSYQQQDTRFDDTKDKVTTAPQSNSIQSYKIDQQKMKPKVENNNKSFTCTECGKGLARKDKLVIHMRIHTGEKPYVCEVCKKAFSRRDKLVIHMNRLKHQTPSNLAPLSKRLPDFRPSLPQRKEMKDESTSPPPQGALRSVEEWSPSAPVKEVAFYSGAGVPYTSPDQSYCLMCHQSFPSREQFMVHLRTHFLAPHHDSTQVCS